MAVSAIALDRRLVKLLPIGRGPSGTNRLAWTRADALAARWFEEQARQAGLRAERDAAGNLWAVPATPPPWWAIGSHLDTVRDGGGYDGALGVTAAFQVAGTTSADVAVISFADEEGARFNTPTFGSRALTGRLELDGLLERRDRDGTTLAEALAGAGVSPAGVSEAPGWLSRLRGFLELHIDQTTELARLGEPVGVVASMAARRRLRIEVEGRADHAGTTAGADRRDALAAAARIVVGAEELAEPGTLATASRIEARPNATTTVPAHVRLWLDVRAEALAPVERWLHSIEALARRLEVERGVRVQVHGESEGAAVRLDADLLERLVRIGTELGLAVPALVSFAGHDAGVLAARVPTAMVLVRNPSGVSHAADERVKMTDAAVGAELLLRLVEELA